MARIAEFDKQDVLEKAMKLFWAKGFNATSLKDLELTLDMRPGSIYAAFGSKEALFSQALELYSSKSRQTLQTTLQDAGSPLAGLAAHVRRFGSNIATSTPSNACMLVKTLLETTHTNPDLKVRTEALMQDIEDAFANAFKEAQLVGEISSDLDVNLLASKLQSDIFGLRAYSERSVDPARISQLAEEIASRVESLQHGRH